MLKHSLIKAVRRGDYLKFTFFVFICCGLLFLQKQRNYSFEYLYFWVAPVRSIPDTLFDLYEKIEQDTSKNNHRVLQSRIDYLQKQNTLLTSQVHQLSLIKQQNNELLKLLEAKSSMPSFTAQLAEVKDIVSGQSPYEITINLNKSDGIKVGQAVVHNQGVVGQVNHVGLVSSKVLLLRAPSVSISVYNKRNGLRAIAHGTSEGIRLQSPDKRLNILSGDVFLTTGLGRVYPANFPVAKVIAVQADRYMISSNLEAVISPYSLRNVLVLTPL